MINREIYEINTKPAIELVVNTRTLQLLGHIGRMTVGRTPKKIIREMARNYEKL